VKFHNKICILLNWSRECDMYSELIKNIPKEFLVLLINDISTAELERKGNASEIESFLKKRNFNYKFFSKEIKNSKYKILISTAEACSYKINTLSVTKYLYGKTIGNILEKTKISSFFIKLFGRPFTAQGSNAVPFTTWYPEKILGDFVIKFPLGMDLNLEHYPNNLWEKNFDLFLTHGKMEMDLILKKFKNTDCKIIGYPRYDKIEDRQKILNDLSKEFNFSNKKKKILWLPTHINFKKEELSNIFLWMDKISKLSNNYDVIIRPHPKSVNLNKSIIETLSKKSFFVDSIGSRKIGNLYEAADLILADYGGPVFSAVYMEKPLLLLNLNKDSRYLSAKLKTKSLDTFFRNQFMSIDADTPDNKIKEKLEIVQNTSYLEKILEFKKNFFGKTKDSLSTSELCNFLLNKLDK